jgi:hypothetical protein
MRRTSLVVAGLLAGCGSVRATIDAGAIDTSEPGNDAAAIDALMDAPRSARHLYVGNDTTTGGIARYTLPLTSTSTIDFTIALPLDFDVAFDASGNLITDDSSGHLAIFTPPLTATSTSVAAFKNGTATAGGQVVITPAGTLIASAQTTALNVFTPPFSNASVPTSSITNAAIAIGLGVALDASANLYVSNPASAGSTLLMFPPPYASATVV